MRGIIHLLFDMLPLLLLVSVPVYIGAIWQDLSHSRELSLRSVPETAISVASGFGLLFDAGLLAFRFTDLGGLVSSSQCSNIFFAGVPWAYLRLLFVYTTVVVALWCVFDAGFGVWTCFRTPVIPASHRLSRRARRSLPRVRDSLRNGRHGRVVCALGRTESSDPPEHKLVI